MSNGTFDFNSFLQESKDTLLNPSSYFSSMKTSGGMAEPLIKAVIYGTAAGVLSLLWSILSLGSAAGWLIGGATGVMAFIGFIIVSVLGLFIGAVVILAFSAVGKGNIDFEACLRISASLLVIVPVSSLLGFISGLSFFVGRIINLIIGFYALWLLYHALVQGLKAKAETVRIIMYVLAALFVLSVILTFIATAQASRLLRL